MKMIYLHFRPDLVIHSFSSAEIILVFPHVTLTWENPSFTLRQRLQGLLEQGNSFPYYEEESTLPTFFYFLDQLKELALLSYTILDEQKPFITLIPLARRNLNLKDERVDPKQNLQLSRFAYIRTSKENTFVLESPLVAASLILKNPKSLEILHALSGPISLEDLIQKIPHISEETLHATISLLSQAFFLSNADQAPSLAFWEFHDLLFHAKSREKTDLPSGATFRFLNQIQPLPALRPIPSDVIPLFKPDLLCTEIMEQRKSIRKQGEKPISKQQLGEFLYRSARVKEQIPSKHHETTRRPYASGGACYELELYPLIHHCEGLEKGLYRYHPDLHALYLCPSTLEDREYLLQHAAQSTQMSELPQVLILIAARFARVSWKYESIAYSLILKDTGALIQTLYLTATAMGLAPCAVGGGNSDLFSKIANTDSYEETTVGEFILGSRPLL